jgi:single-stranded-DNA-specific exonuclease
MNLTIENGHLIMRCIMSFYTIIKGINTESRQNAVKRLRNGEQVFLVREPDNPLNKFAIAVLNFKEEQLGYLIDEITEPLAFKMDIYKNLYRATVVNWLEDKDSNSFSVNIFIEDLGE